MQITFIRYRNVRSIYFVNIFANSTMAFIYFYVFTVCKYAFIDIDICGIYSKAMQKTILELMKKIIVKG